jgi:hypothetical protein
MIRPIIYFLLFLCIFSTKAQETSPPESSFILETSLHAGYIVRNSGDVPHNNTPIFLTINPSFQTKGRDSWHQFYGFPKIGCRVTFGNLGNNKELGNIIGLTPNMTLKTSATRWYIPTINMGIGIAWFNKPYDIENNPANFYIGSQITAMAEAGIQVEPKLGEKTSLIAGFHVIHCSNSHYQVPNLGMNLISVRAGLVFNAGNNFQPVRKDIELPQSKLRLNFRTGIGVHELARTFGPAGTPKYKIYVNDIYLSKRYGKISNVQAGLEINYYKSYYNFIVTNNLFENDRHLKATVFTAFLGHELMIKRFSLLTQGGVNLYNKFYNSYISMYKSERGMSLALKKIFSSRLGLQYYFFDPQYNTRSNVFIGAYIKANFGQADFACMQVGVVF